MRQELIEQLSIISPEELKYLSGEKCIDMELYTSSSSLIIDSAKLLEKGKLIQIRPHTRFIRFPEHKHNYVEVTYMMQGKTTHIINGKEVILEEGDLIFLNQNVTQEILAAGKNDIAINFIILPEFFDKAFSMLVDEENQLRDFIISCLRQNNCDSLYLHFRTKGIVPIENLLENIIWSILHKKYTNRSIDQLSMGLLFLHLSSHLNSLTIGESSYKNELTLKIYHYIDEHYKTATLCELSNILQYDFVSLSREIKKLTGKTFKELLQEKRLSQARYLFKTTRLPIDQIIENVGYSNTSYFYKIFKKKYNVLPSEFRLKLE